MRWLRGFLEDGPKARTAIEDAADDAGLVAACDHTFCYTSAVNRIRTEISSGNLGTIQYIDSTRINLGIVQRDIADVLRRRISGAIELHERTLLQLNQ